MTTLAAIAVITTVLGFMSMVLANFPTVETDANSIEDTTAEGFGVKAVKKATDGFQLAYISVIESLTSYMDDPDYQRAEQSAWRWSATQNTSYPNSRP